MHFYEVPRRDGGDTAMIDGILQRAAGLLEQGCSARLGWRQLDTGGEGCVIHSHDEDRPTAIVAHSDHATQMLAVRSRFCRCNHLAGRFQGKRLLLRQLRQRTLHCSGRRAAAPPASTGYSTIRLSVVAFRTAARGTPVSNVTNLASFSTARARRYMSVSCRGP